jgi:hypothetical protein
MPKRVRPEPAKVPDTEEVGPRQQLATCATLDDVVERLRRAKSIVVRATVKARF